MGNTLKSLKASSDSPNQAAQIVQEAITTYPVVIFSKSYCPYCISAKRDIASAGNAVEGFQQPKIYELNNMGTLGSQIQGYLAKTTGRRTVPNVFIGGKTVGGGDEVAGYARRGVLKQMLAQAGARMAAEDLSKAKELVDEAIENNPIVVFSKTTCPYCRAAKAALNDVATRVDKFEGPKVIEVNTMGDLGVKVQEYLAEKTGRRTVPNVFMNGKSIGGGDDVRAYAASGELDRMVSAAIGVEVTDGEQTVKDIVEEAIANNPITVFSKSYCPYCIRAKRLVATTGQNIEGFQPPKIFELDEIPEGEAMQQYLLEKTGQRTVPSIFIGGKHIGGSDSLAEVAGRNGLVDLIKEAQASGPAAPEDATLEAENMTNEEVLTETAAPAPEAAVLAPEAAVLAPEAAVLAPEAAVLAPVAAVPAPVAAVPAPEAAVPAPEATAVADTVTVTAPADATTAAEAILAEPDIKEITFGAGCFWGVELAFQRVVGVTKTEVGYSNGKVPRVTYDAICTGLTGATEVVRVWYDPSVVTLAELLKVWESRHDPTSLNRQGNDTGTQYRSAVYYTDQEQADEVAKWNTDASQRLGKPIVTEIAPVKNYCEAEEYHQRYLEKKGQSAEKEASTPIRCYG